MPLLAEPYPAFSTLYYDGRCPLCAHEMRWLARYKSADLQLADIHSVINLSDEEREAMLRRLHLQTESGEWLLGVDANVKAWSYTPIGFLWKPLRWKWFAPLVDRLYARWADRRYRCSYTCQLKES